jgi:internalin A
MNNLLDSPDGEIVRPLIAHKDVIFNQLQEGAIIRIDSISGIFNFGIMFINDVEPVDVNIKGEVLENSILGQLCLTSMSDNGKKNTGARVVQLASRFHKKKPFTTDFLTVISPRERDSEEGYIHKPHKVEIILRSNIQDGILGIDYVDSDGLKFYKYIKTPRPLPYFRYFTWGPMAEETIMVNTVPLNETNQEFEAFRIGNIVVRKGDMFNTDAILNTNILFLPASDTGTVTPTIRAKADELHLPPPVPTKVGSAIIYSLPEEKNVYAGYAYSVEGDSSSIQIIEKICLNIIDILQDLSLNPHRVTGVNIPLLGTGAGGLDPAIVMETYLNYFNRPDLSTNIVISIPSPETYDLIKKRYRYAYIPMLHGYFNEKPPQATSLENELGTSLSGTDFEIGFGGQLTSLSLINKDIANGLSALASHTSIRYLILDRCKVEDFSSIAFLKNLRSLSMRGCSVVDYSFLERLVKLESLDLAAQVGPFLEKIIPLLPRFSSLGLSSNNIANVSFLSGLEKLKSLELAFNQIGDITPLLSLKNLSELSISNNLVRDITPALRLRKLRFLDASDNLIDDINLHTLPKSMQFLRIGNNPFLTYSDISLPEGDNHLGAIRNYLLRQAEEDKIPVKLPAKVLLMGNHAAGKSSLLHYLQTNKLPEKQDSTHIIQIQQYPRQNPELPKAIFYDFGGQDYYHGIYRGFLSGGAVNIILWNAAHNANQLRKDSRGYMTQDFSLGYWLAQKQYIEVEKHHSEYSPTLIVQTHADQHPRQPYLPKANIQPIENDFFVCLSKKANSIEGVRTEVAKKALKYLKASLDAIIEESSIQRDEPRWYIDFLVFILQQNVKADYRGTKVNDLLPYYNRKVRNKLPLLVEDLKQLNRQGLILYYHEYIPDMVWLNPVALVDHVHKNILSQDLVGGSNGLIATGKFAKEDENVINLLLKQKVIYLHAATGEYILPNFLPLAKYAKAEFELYTFGLGDPVFTLKFREFLPFGLINQIICFFGELPEEKKFWRDRIIFTLESKAKVLVNIDFQRLEITVYASFISGLSQIEKLEVEKYLFYGIMGLYWDLNLLKFKDYIAYLHGQLKNETFSLEDPLTDKLFATENFYQNAACRPDDLFISVNRKDFISYCDICDIGDGISINSQSVDRDGNFDGKSKTINAHQFQAFTLIELKRRKKVAISYSKQDLVLVNKFREYLIPLYDDELIDHPWYCTELIAGTDWDQEIQKKFDAADIIFFMVSENLMSTRYVMENEIKNAIDRYNHGTPIKIVPIVMVPYRFQRKGEYNLGRFSALPYTLMPITLFENENMAWHTVSESIRVMIEKDLDPGRSDELPIELKRYFEDIITEKKFKKANKKSTKKDIDDKKVIE